MTAVSGRSPLRGSGHSAEPEPCCTVSAVPASVPNAEELVREKFSVLINARSRLAAEAAQVESQIRDCRAAARVFGVALQGADPTPITDRATIANVVTQILIGAGARGATVTEMRPTVEANYGAQLHPKSIGVALLRMSKGGSVKRVGRRWFAMATRVTPTMTGGESAVGEAETPNPRGGDSRHD